MFITGLGAARVKIKTGEECLISNVKNIEYKLIEFWRWSTSDLLSNATRGKFAEYIVATAMDADLSLPIEEWSEYDLNVKGIKIEVKTSSYLQTWSQSNYSKIIFLIKRKGDTSVKTKKEDLNRPSDLYVFCLLNHKDKKTVNPLNMDQWLFYVLSTNKINNIFKEKNSISLEKLEKEVIGIKYDELKERILNEYQNK